MWNSYLIQEADVEQLPDSEGRCRCQRPVAPPFPDADDRKDCLLSVTDPGTTDFCEESYHSFWAGDFQQQKAS
jgi:hypothetical protein